MVLLLISLRKLKVNHCYSHISILYTNSLPNIKPTEQKKLPFAELVLLRGDTHRGKLPLGWNMVKALHAPWITPIKGTKGEWTKKEEGE